MGNWQLEVAKFGLYIFAPVASFYYFHKVENFEDKLEEYHRKQNSATSIQNEKMIKECQQKLRELREAKFKRELATFESPQETGGNELTKN